MWEQGVYHGHGRKRYSRGGRYEGAWLEGKREGGGKDFYSPTEENLGRHGILRWEGPFVGDWPGGVGQAYVKAKDFEGDERGSGGLAVTGAEHLNLRRAGP